MSYYIPLTSLKNSEFESLRADYRGGGEVEGCAELGLKLQTFKGQRPTTDWLLKYRKKVNSSVIVLHKNHEREALWHPGKEEITGKNDGCKLEN